MSDILFIKTSSLGDVIHHLPAITDARAHLPQARLSWVVEEAFAPLAKLHPAVDQVIPVASRRWRHHPFQARTWAEVRGFVGAIRSRRYDVVVDTQGLLRSGLIVWLARGPSHGYGAHSIREPLATLFYRIRHRVDYAQHAIARNRILTGLALGYTPTGGIDYGLDRAAAAAVAQTGAAPYAVLLHATAGARKEWPEDRWIALGRALSGRGLTLFLPWGKERERARSLRLAAAIPGAVVPEFQPAEALARRIAGARFVIGVDTGFLHLAAAFGVPLVGIFLGSMPGLTGPMGTGPIEIVGDHGGPPPVGDVLAALQRIAPG